jgi:hypothetical protein
MEIRSKKRALETLQETKGRIFTAVFTKRTTGEKRTINARINVKKGVKGVGMSFDPVKKGLLPVYDMQKQGFRMIDLESIEEINFDGQHIEFRDEE